MQVRNLMILLCLLLSSCKAKQVLVRSVKTDSVRITEQYKDTTIIIPGDTLRLTFPLLIADTVSKKVTYIAKGKRSSVQVNVGSGKIGVTSICDQYEAKVKLLENTIERYKHETSVYKEKESAFKATIHKMHSMFKSWAAIALIVLLVWGAFRLKTFLFNNFKNS